MSSGGSASTDSMEGSSPSPTTNVAMDSPTSMVVANPLPGTADYEAGNYFEQAHEFFTRALSALANGTGLASLTGTLEFGTYEHWGKKDGKSVCVASVENVLFVSATGPKGSKGDGWSLTYEELVSALNGLMNVITTYGPVSLRGDWGSDDPTSEDFWAANTSLMSLTITPANSAPPNRKASHYAGMPVCALSWGLKSVWGKMGRSMAIARRSTSGATRKDTIRAIQNDFGVSGKVTQKALSGPEVKALLGDHSGPWHTAPNKADIVALVRQLIGDGVYAEDAAPVADVVLTRPVETPAPAAAPETVAPVAAVGLDAETETAIALLMGRGMSRAEAICVILG